VDVPPPVERARALALELGIEETFSAGDGPLLHVLAARRGLARAGATSSGGLVGAAWLVSALPPAVPLAVAERDPRVAAALAQLLADDPTAGVRAGDWRDVLPRSAPFDLLLVDGRDPRGSATEAAALLTPGGTALVVAPREDEWLRLPGVAAAAVGTGTGRRAIVAARLVGA
jgi:predicted O-methyltransferase YrrM